jgi:hypothetical protein
MRCEEAKSMNGTPTPNPSPQGGGEPAEFAAKQKFIAR